MKFPRPSQEDDVSINLVSLIDVLFILIIFFMVSTTFVQERKLSVELPKAMGEESGKTTAASIEVIVGRDGDYAVNNKTLAARDAKTLERAVLEQSGGDTTLPFIIAADAAAPYQAVVTVMDVAGQLGFTHLRLPANEPGTEAAPEIAPAPK
ncbi:Biopolymer transport protein ExbD/TolR [gamma proteobacterium HdN1]|nr:Biopolymer transport protein ExbD/TolR [gamma proteobacterium HdN1]